MTKESPQAQETIEPKTVTFGNIQLPIINAAEFVPAKSTIIDNVEELQTLALAVQRNVPCLLIGDTGTGKTSFIRYMAYQTKNGYRRLNLNGGTTADELVGHYVADPQAKGMRWIDGVLVEAMKKGYWLLLDELNAALPEVLFKIHSLLDDDRFLVLEEHEGEIVRPHENFRIFAGMNTSLEYAGTKDMNKALISRFPIVIQTHHPEPLKEIAILKFHAPDLKDDDAMLMVRVAEEIRNGKKQSTLGFICSTRDLIHWAKLRSTLPMKESAELAVLNKIDSSLDRKTVDDIFKLIFGKWEAKEFIGLGEIEKQIENEKAARELAEERALASQTLLESLKNTLTQERDLLTKTVSERDQLRQIIDLAKGLSSAKTPRGGSRKKKAALTDEELRSSQADKSEQANDIF